MFSFGKYYIVGMQYLRVRSSLLYALMMMADANNPSITVSNFVKFIKRDNRRNRINKCPGAYITTPPIVRRHFRTVRKAKRNNKHKKSQLLTHAWPPHMNNSFPFLISNGEGENGRSKQGVP